MKLTKDEAMNIFTNSVLVDVKKSIKKTPISEISIKSKDYLLKLKVKKGNVIYTIGCCAKDPYADTELLDGFKELKELLGQKITSYDEVSSSIFLEDFEENYNEHAHQVWTYYKFRGEKDDATLRFYSYSNGFYAVGVDFEVVKTESLN